MATAERFPIFVTVDHEITRRAAEQQANQQSVCLNGNPPCGLCGGHVGTQSPFSTCFSCRLAAARKEG